MPVALCRPGDALSGALRRYKDAPAPDARAHHAHSLTRMLRDHLEEHGSCLWSAAGGWDAVAVVPSSRPGALAVAHPLMGVAAAAGLASPTGTIRLVGLGRPPAHLRPRPEWVAVAGEVEGRRVLLLDDTWTTGAHAFSATGAIGRRGATVAAVLVLGRTVDPGAAPALADWWGRMTAGPASAACCIEGQGGP
ncbi:MAG TPA: phosphoribosyltransferase [Acidimicrobiales bacterium]|nr:phosphoribosyltransferase [Acidimicrobiales bacterium]